MTGLTFDTGALVALERRRLRMQRVFEHALARRIRITVPADVVAEWWRGRTDMRDALLRSVMVEPLDSALARATGEALAAVPTATLVDAVVMASAARRGDLVYTADVDDLQRLTARFPAVRVLGV